MDAKNTDNREIEQNSDDEHDYGKLLAIIVVVIAAGFVFLAIVSGPISFFEKIFNELKPAQTNGIIIKQLRNLAVEINSRAPIRINEDTIITSVAVSEPATFIFRALSPNLMAADVENNNVADGIKTLAHGMACNNNLLADGFKNGASMRFVFSTIDGYEIDSGITNSASCQ